MSFRIQLENGIVQPQPLDLGEEFFGVSTGLLTTSTVGEFWKWAYSNIVDNTTRGVLAEFIVAKAIEADTQARNVWDTYDLITPSGIKVEVKSSSYLQSWYQEKPSTVRFGISKTLEWLPESSEFAGPSRRHADVYVFCLISQLDKKMLNPLDLSQWEFFIVQTSDINTICGDRKSIGLHRVKDLSDSYAVENLSAGIESLLEPDRSL